MSTWDTGPPLRVLLRKDSPMFEQFHFRVSMYQDVAERCHKYFVGCIKNGERSIPLEHLSRTFTSEKEVREYIYSDHVKAALILEAME